MLDASGFKLEIPPRYEMPISTGRRCNQPRFPVLRMIRRSSGWFNKPRTARRGIASTEGQFVQWAQWALNLLPGRYEPRRNDLSDLHRILGFSGAVVHKAQFDTWKCPEICSFHRIPWRDRVGEHEGEHSPKRGHLPPDNRRIHTGVGRPGDGARVGSVFELTQPCPALAESAMSRRAIERLRSQDLLVAGMRDPACPLGALEQFTNDLTRTLERQPAEWLNVRRTRHACREGPLSPGRTHFAIRPILI